MTTKPAQTHMYIFWVVHLLAGQVSNIAKSEYSAKNMHFGLQSKSFCFNIRYAFVHIRILLTKWRSNVQVRSLLSSTPYCMETHYETLLPLGGDPLRDTTPSGWRPTTR